MRDVVLLQGAGGGVDVPLACCIVGVKAVLTGTAAGEVLHGHGNTLGGNTVAAALDAGDQVVEDLLDQCGVLAKGAEGALPTGVGDAVGHVHVALLQPQAFHSRRMVSANLSMMSMRAVPLTAAAMPRVPG